MILPDGNLIIAFKWTAHAHHSVALSFFSKHPKVATCAITELNLQRVLMQLKLPDADKLLTDFVLKHRSRLFPCDISATETAGLNSHHKETTDNLFAKLAAHHGLKVAPLDRGFAERFPGLVELISSHEK